MTADAATTEQNVPDPSERPTTVLAKGCLTSVGARLRLTSGMACSPENNDVVQDVTGSTPMTVKAFVRCHEGEFTASAPG